MKIKMEIDKAIESAGYREKYAMEHGTRTSHMDRNGNLYWKWTYSEDDEYQDANGATYHINTHSWVA